MSYTVLKKRRSRLSLLIFVAILLYAMVGSILYLLQDQFIFRPTVLPENYVYNFDREFEELFLKTDDDAVINALHFKVEQPRGVMLYFHGNAGNLARWGEVTEFFVEMGYDVLVMDYRGYGKSTGPLSEKALYHDGQQCYNYLLQRYDEVDITVYGRSLGTGIATRIAATNGVKQLILESPFYNLTDVAKTRFPIFPVKKLLKYKLPNNLHIDMVRCPVTIYHGTDDYIIPYKSGEKLFFESRNGKTDLIPIEGGGHNNLINFEAYRDHVTRLLEQ
ncbi:MAG: alpha/beta hydrolase [Flavobacteriaceae bacterium]|nr:alpha/beta hydrolase [Bacteroidia bacterium]MBT8288628.1 alpha/beta hydrolase [Bacteroidia bacterium]NNF74474.1 alpha/beta hydrolase [Flavobacteriaceae bacterium]NNK74341.1 alpha/beta hydrolase [Flavobacteriaceae bacterium]